MSFKNFYQFIHYDLCGGIMFFSKQSVFGNEFSSDNYASSLSFI